MEKHGAGNHPVSSEEEAGPTKGEPGAAWGTSRGAQMRKEVAEYEKEKKGGQLFSGVKGQQKVASIRDMKMPEEIDTTEGAKEAKELQKKFNDGFFGQLAKSKNFEICTIGFIILNALAITWDADTSARFEMPANLYDGPWYFIFLENLFAVYFSGEILIRFIGYRVKSECIYDRWFVFDASLVTLMVLETWIMPFIGGAGMGNLSVLRLLRLLRITRMAKLMRAFPELLMIVKGISAATRAVAWTAFLLVLISFTFSIIFTNEFHEGPRTDDEIAEMDDDDPAKGTYQFFGDMGKSMLSLLIMGTILDDVTACSDVIRASGNFPMLAIFIVYILLNSFMMLNMLVGILVEVVGNTAENENDRVQHQKAQESIITIFRQLDTDHSGHITKDEFAKMKDDDSVMQALQELGIKEKHFDSYVKLLFNPINSDGTVGVAEPMSFKTLLDAICRLRPGTCVNLLDFSTLKMVCARSHANLQARIRKLDRIVVAGSEEVTKAPSKDSEEKSPSQQKVVQQARKKVNFQMMDQLEKTDSSDIVTELQRRLGVTHIDEIPVSMMDEELYESVCMANGWTPENTFPSPTPSSEPPVMAW